KVANDLNVRYVVQGSVQRVGDQVRVSAQLADAQSDKNLWNRTYDRKVADLFELQDEISSTVAASLIVDLTRAEGERAQQRGMKDRDAWSAYELGMQRMNRMTTAADAAAARASFERALEIEPDSASALAALASVYAYEVAYGWTDSPESNSAKALELARRSVK